MFSFLSTGPRDIKYWLSQHLPPPKGFKDYYNFKIDEFYKIWFSDNPDVFLGIENELRFIRMRENNKTHQLAFIYSPRCLNSNALEKLKKFCAKFTIQPVNFDTDVQDMLTEPLDIAMYDIAQLEIQNTLDNAYGNLAAASDCARLLVPVIKQFGIYTDFDVEHTLSRLGAHVVRVRAPVLLNSQISYDHHEASIFANSDFLAFSFDSDNPATLSAEALTAIRNLQEAIIEKYSKPLTSSSFTMDPTCKIDFGPAGEFFRQAKNNPTIFEFRRFISNFEPKNNMMKAMKQNLYDISVIAVTGPDIYPVMYKQLIPAKYKFIPYKIPRDDAWGMYLSIFNKSSLKFYDPIADRITLLISIAEALQSPLSIGTRADKSWTSVGSSAKQQRERKMNAAASTLQSFWRNKRDDHKILLYRAKPFCTPNYLKYLQEKSYTLVLRNACNELNFKLVKLILHYKDRLHIDVNEPSRKTNNTALDWANAATTDTPASKDMIVKLLIDAGAKSGKELSSVCNQR
jgi:hypothetical protein